MEHCGSTFSVSWLVFEVLNFVWSWCTLLSIWLYDLLHRLLWCSIWVVVSSISVVFMFAPLVDGLLLFTAIFAFYLNE